MVTILMISAKLATPGLLKIKIFQNEGYDAIIPDYDVIIPDYDVINLVALAFLREFIITSNL